MAKAINDFSIEIIWSITTFRQVIIKWVSYQNNTEFDTLTVYQNNKLSNAEIENLNTIIKKKINGEEKEITVMDYTIFQLSEFGSSSVFWYLSKLWYEKIDNRDLVNNR